ncbi:helix-turn-helix transcriptional regulator [Streptomyces sp. NPDC006393]|uniref:helix-turn-helix transcriptional regulator n=1 Tax=Streptomyces sp. NPDC006393 TaxID=3156763 RepID=UPI0034106E30
MAKHHRKRQLEELSHFLRSRRMRLNPADVGLNTSGRRRTPGLRREEVAVLAGVGTSWYTWLEQGRDINVSESVLGAISGALRLNPAEEIYLHRLAGLRTPDVDQRADSGPDDPERLAEIVNHWFPNPALVRDRCWNILAANSAVPEFLGFPGPGGNILVEFFTDESCRRRYVQAEALARSTVARFRADVADCFGRPEVERIVDELNERSPQFARLWSSHEVLEPMKSRAKEIVHGEVGTLGFDVHEWELAADHEIQLVLHMPTAQDTREKLDAFFAAAGPEAEDPDRPGEDGDEDGQLSSEKAIAAA